MNPRSRPYGFFAGDYLAAPEPSYAQRIADLKSLTRLLKDNKDELVAAINADYGNRSEFETLFAEYFVVLETVADTSIS